MSLSSVIMNSLYSIANGLIPFIPTVLAIIILALVGLILGKILGKIGGKVLGKIGLDSLIDKTAIGGMINKAEMSTAGVFEAIIRWFIYLVFAVIIIDLLNIQVVADFIAEIILYIPLLFSALVVLIIGFMVVDFLASLIKKVIMATGIDDSISKSAICNIMKASGTTVSGIVSGLVKLFGYLIFLLIASEILKFTIITEFLNMVLDYIPHLFTGIMVLIIGFLAIDFVVDYLQVTMKGMNVEGTDIMVPLLRGFFFMLVILLSLDIMKINTSIFYVFLNPLAWGLAVVVAFRWGVKEAMVAYAEAKK